MVVYPKRALANDSAKIDKHLSQQMLQHKVIRGHFEQQRTLTGIPRPIRSSGRFIYWRNHGLYWETKKPIFQASTFTPDTIIHWQTNSAKRQADRSSSPIQKQISRILLAVFGGDTESLKMLFDSHVSSKGEEWQIVLTPAIDVVKKAVEKITLNGKEHVNKLYLSASNGDASQILFLDVSTYPHLAADDCSYFDVEPSSCPNDKTGTQPSNQPDL